MGVERGRQGDGERGRKRLLSPSLLVSPSPRLVRHQVGLSQSNHGLLPEFLAIIRREQRFGEIDRTQRMRLLTKDRATHTLIRAVNLATRGPMRQLRNKANSATRCAAESVPPIVEGPF